MNGVVLAVKEAAEEAGVERALLELVNLRASQINGCAFCIEIHHKAAVKAGVPEQKRVMLAAWEEAAHLYTPRERAALQIAESMTLISQGHLSDGEYEVAREELGDDVLSVVEWATVVINAFNRISVFSGYRVRERADKPADKQAADKPTE